MAIGISTACWFEKNIIEDAIKRIGKMGITDAEVFLNTFSEYTPEFADTILKIAQDNGVKFIAAHPQGIQFEGQLYSHYERSQKDGIKIFKDVLSCINRLGAHRYIYHGGISHKRARNNVLKFDKIGKMVSMMADVAADYDVKLLYENVHWCWFSYPEFAHDLLCHISSKNLYFNLDIKQAVQSGYSIDAYIDAMGDKLDYVHLCDTVHENGFVEPRLPFAGEVDFKKMAQKLKQVGFSGDMTLEVYSNDFASDDELSLVHKKLVETFC